jgi:hypothetical protein
VIGAAEGAGRPSGGILDGAGNGIAVTKQAARGSGGIAGCGGVTASYAGGWWCHRGRTASDRDLSENPGIDDRLTLRTAGLLRLSVADRRMVACNRPLLEPLD